MSIDLVETDGDSGFEDGNVITASTSLASSASRYRFEYGRRYHAFREGDYKLPNDEEEQERLDLLHLIYLRTLGGKLHEADLPEGVARVLDIGTGTGSWAVDFADMNPGAQVIGFDLSAIQPEFVPPNLNFYVDDLEQELTDEHLTFVHLRGMSGCVSNWHNLLAGVYAKLVRGGYLEIQDAEIWDNSSEGMSGPIENLQKWQQLCCEGSGKHKGLRTSDSYEHLMSTTGFVDIHKSIKKVPIGTWHDDAEMKRLGADHLKQMCQCIAPYTYGYVGKCLGWSQEECQELIQKVVEELRNPSLRLYTRFTFVHARKL